MPISFVNIQKSCLKHLEVYKEKLSTAIGDAKTALIAEKNLAQAVFAKTGSFCADYDSRMLELEGRLSLISKDDPNAGIKKTAIIADKKFLENAFKSYLARYNKIDKSLSACDSIQSPPLLARKKELLQKLHDANDIYNQYITYYNTCSDDIHNIDLLPVPQRSAINVVQDRATIVAQQALLFPIYQADCNSKTLIQFVADCSPIVILVQSAYNNAIGPVNPTQQQITADYNAAQTIVSAISSDITSDMAALGSVPAIQATLTALQTQITNLPEGPTKNKAQTDWTSANAALSALSTSITAAQPHMSALQTAMQSIQGPTGLLSQLQSLAGLTSPTPDNLTTANNILATIQQTQITEQTFQNGLMATVSNALSSVQAAIAVVQTDITPAPPPPKPGTIEHACWMVDWTSWPPFPVPENVDKVHIFVLEICLTQPGNVPTIQGAGNMKPSNIKDFAARCKAQGVGVKISIGGGGGSYDNCWDSLNTGNIGTFATLLADYCHTNGLVGIDFDYEDHGSDPAQYTLVGNLIQQFKAQDPTFETSLCSNAGFGPNFPWQAKVKGICDGAKNPDGSCALDRLYVMAYYNDLESEEGWVSGWADWMLATYGMPADHITFGLDNTDCHVVDIAKAAEWSATQGISTGYWEWDPANVASSNASTALILNSYNAGLKLSKTAKRINLLAQPCFAYPEGLPPTAPPVEHRPLPHAPTEFGNFKLGFALPAEPMSNPLMGRVLSTLIKGTDSKLQYSALKIQSVISSPFRRLFAAIGKFFTQQYQKQVFSSKPLHSQHLPINTSTPLLKDEDSS